MATAESVFGRFVSDCYPPPLELEVEEHDGCFDLLESTVTVFPEGGGWVMHRSKNWDHFARTGRRRFRVWTGGDSWTGSRRGVLIGTLLRVEACCTRRPEVLALRMRAVLRALVEAQLWGGYSMSALCRCLSYLGNRATVPEQAGLWRLLRHALRAASSMVAVYVQFCQWMGSGSLLPVW